MQVHGVKSGIVSASNGGCDAFDINRSLAEGVSELSHDFSESSLASLALGIIAMQRRVELTEKKGRKFSDCAETLSKLEI